MTPLDALRRATELDPTSAAAWLALARALHAQGGVAEPMACFERALRLAPAEPAVLVATGGFLLEQGELSDAAALFRAAGADGAAGLLQVLERQGDLVGAATIIEQHAGLLGRSPAFTVGAARVLARTGAGERAKGALETVARSSLAQATRVAVEHALGDVLEALGDAPAAFDAHGRAHAARGLRWDVDAHTARVDALIRDWTRDRFGPAATAGDEVVFIVGMPRSGTTLVEQILASHPSVRTCGELDTLPDVEGLDPAEAAARYLARLRRDGAAPRILDKLPLNFQHLHTAARLFAGARVIHLRRDPLDTCVSCWSKHFHGTLAWTTDLHALGRFYTDHLRLMAHWREHLPLPILGVHYEAVVDDPEAETRRLLGFLDLPFDPGCLRFFERRDVAHTASYAQVRRPIHRGAVGRAAVLGARLDPLRLALSETIRPQ